jgi:hypothetical protein
LFGYIKPCEAELKVREMQLFKAYYCGLCSVLGRTASLTARLSLNYDMVFLNLLLASLDKTPEQITPGRCLLHPAVKRPFAGSGAVSVYCAHINSLLTWLKLADDRQDEGSVRAWLAAPFFRRPAKKAQKAHPLYWEEMELQLRALRQLEKENRVGMDQAADPFARLIGAVCAAPFVSDQSVKDALYWTGYNLGRWIYLLDACDDLERDLRKNCYNPVFTQFKSMYHGALPEFTRSIRDIMEERLIFTLDSAAKAYELIPVQKNKELLDNIVYLGLRKRTDDILNRF